MQYDGDGRFSRQWFHVRAADAATVPATCADASTGPDRSRETGEYETLFKDRSILNIILFE